MSFINKLLVASAFVLLLGGGMASAQQPVKPVNPSGAVLFPSAFASADNIAAQTATFLHGGLMAWDSGGSNWDRVLLTAGALNVQIQNSSLAVTGTFWQATQPISGSVTANAGTNLNTSALMLDATFTGRTPAGASPADNESNTNTALSRIGAFNFIWDAGGSNWDRWTGAVTQLGTWNITNISGTISLPTGASTLAEQQTHTTSLQLIDDLPLAQGSTTSGQKGLMGMGAVTTAAPSYTTSQTSPLSLTTAGLLRTDGSGVTQPVSGTVTANAGTNLNTSLLALDSTLTGGTQKTKLVDTGGTNVGSISAAGALKVDGSAVTQPVSGTITANAGTNLNTSLLALDASVTVLGATADAAATVGSTGSASAKLRLMTSQLDAIQTAVQLIDNAVSGAGYNITQFGGSNIVTGTGASGAGIPRTTISNDSSLAANQSVNVNQLAGAVFSATNFLPGRLTDGTGYIDSDVIGSIRYLKTSMIQDIAVSANNSSTANLAAGATFTGTSESTLGVGSIQVNLAMDQNAVIEVQQAQQDPGTSWDISDIWTYTANSKGNDAARTIQATGSSFRVLVTNKGAATTTALRLQSIICPVCDALPRGLTQLGNLKTAIVEPLVNQYGVELGTAINPIMVAIAPAFYGATQNLVTQTSRLLAGPFNTPIGISGDRLKTDPTPSPDVCARSIKADVPISQTASTTIIPGQPGRSISICLIRLVMGTAEIVSEWEGTGSACATGKIVHSGSATAANGESFATNGGYSSGDGNGSVITLNPGNDFCIGQNGANRVSGKVSYVYGP